MENHIYTYVLHPLKDYLELSDNEYYVLDTIEILSQKSGWCYKSKNKIAADLFISERTVNLAIKKLLVKDLIQKKSDNPKYLKPTVYWYKTKEKFKKLIKESNVELTEDLAVKRRKLSNPTAQHFSKTPNKLRIRKTKEKNLEDKELNRKLDDYLKF